MWIVAHSTYGKLIHMDAFLIGVLRDDVFTWLATLDWLEVRGVQINLFIVDEGVKVHVIKPKTNK